MRYQSRNSEFHLSAAELERIITHTVNQRNRLILQVFVYTGIRRAELRELRKRDLDPARSRLLVRKGKGGKQRLLYLPRAVTEGLIAFCRSHCSEFVFPGRAGGPMSLRNLNYIVAHAARRAGVDTPNPRYRNVGPHLLRHSFARNWKRAGGSLESLQKILGHQSLRTTLDVYGTESQQETRDNYFKMVGVVFQCQP